MRLLEPSQALKLASGHWCFHSGLLVAELLTYGHLEDENINKCGEPETDKSMIHFLIVAHTTVLICDSLRNFSRKCFRSVEMSEFLRFARAVVYFSAILWINFVTITHLKYSGLNTDAIPEDCQQNLTILQIVTIIEVSIFFAYMVNAIAFIMIADCVGFRTRRQYILEKYAEKSEMKA